MTGPAGNIEFCFPRPQWAVLRKQNLLFSPGQPLRASYSIWTTSSLPSASPWRENDYKLVFLDIPDSREPDGRLTTDVNWTSTDTDQYLAYDSHHLQSVKRGIIVKCFYVRAKRLVTKLSVIQGEKAPVFCSCLWWLTSFFLAENQKDQ